VEKKGGYTSNMVLHSTPVKMRKWGASRAQRAGRKRRGGGVKNGEVRKNEKGGDGPPILTREKEKGEKKKSVLPLSFLRKGKRKGKRGRGRIDPSHLTRFY